jgi:hypothetical protein
LALDLFDEESARENFRFATVLQVYAQYLLVINKLDECIHYSYKAFEFFDKMGYDRDAADSLKCSIKA